MTMSFRNGEVWLVRYQFDDDPTQSKVRPVVIINGQAMVIYGYKMTSQRARSDREYIIKDLDAAGLQKKTVIRTSKFIQIEEAMMIRKIGQLSLADITAFRKLLPKKL